MKATLSVTEFFSRISPAPGKISEELWEPFAPARHYLLEWQHYWLEVPEATHLQVGGQRVVPEHGAWFHVRFENALGLTTLQPFAHRSPLCKSIPLVVLSDKLPTPQAYWRFFRDLVTDLYHRAIQMPFHYSAPTGIGVSEANRPPAPLFVYHFLLQHAAALHQALAVLLARPHRELHTVEDEVPLGEASQADADTLLSVLHHPEDWVPARGIPLARVLQGHAPREVIQRFPEETTDTAPNRFIAHFLRQLVRAAEDLFRQPWWADVPQERRDLLRRLVETLRHALHHPALAEAGPMQQLPLQSQVLLRREGYRELLQAWRLFHQARRPLFGAVEQTIEVRDVATLYEYWVFFALVEEIQIHLETVPRLNLRYSAIEKLGWQAEAIFQGQGKLMYNKTWQGYSGKLRPDYTWVRARKEEVALDAKFRLERPQEGESPESTARRGDLDKMHTYRDALGVRAAVAVYPGDTAAFYPAPPETRRQISLRELLLGDWQGIGALPVRPGAMTAKTQSEEAQWI